VDHTERKGNKMKATLRHLADYEERQYLECGRVDQDKVYRELKCGEIQGLQFGCNTLRDNEPQTEPILVEMVTKLQAIDLRDGQEDNVRIAGMIRGIKTVLDLVRLKIG